MKRGQWKFGNKEFESSYEWIKGERMFVLTAVETMVKDKRKVFESHEKAKAAGFVLQKKAK